MAINFIDGTETYYIKTVPISLMRYKPGLSFGFSGEKDGHILTADEMPRHTHGAEFYRGDNPCFKCKKFPMCVYNGSAGNHEGCFAEREV